LALLELEELSPQPAMGIATAARIANAEMPRGRKEVRISES